MLFVTLVLLGVALAVIIAASRQSASSAPARPPAAPARANAHPRPPNPPSPAARRHWTADDLPGPGGEPTRLRQHYRARGGVDFAFSFERQPSGRWRAYIEQGMPYGPRPDGIAVTHRHRDGQRYYVCYEPEPASLRGMAKVAAYWADMTVVYVRTGRTIDQQVNAPATA